MTTPATGGDNTPQPGSGAAAAAAGAGDGAGAAAASGATGSGGEEFLTYFPEDLRSEKTLHKFKGKDQAEVLGKLAKSYVHLEKWQIPGEGATAEEKAAYHRRLGIPEKVADYSSALKPEVPEGVPWTPEIQTQFAEFAHAEGLTPAQATKVLNFYLSRAGQGIDVQKTNTAEDLKKATDGLKSKWNAGYERNVGLVHRAVEEYGKPEFSEMLDSVVIDGVKLGNHPAMLEFLAWHGEQRLEGGYLAGDSLLTTTASAQAELSAILDDSKHPYWQGDKASIAKVQKLLAIVEAPKPNR